MACGSASLWVVIAAVASVACSGESKRSGTSHRGDGEGGSSGSGATGGSAGSGTNGGSAGNAGSGTNGGSGGYAGTGGGSVAGGGGSAGSYVPDRSDVPPDGDGRISGGSIEQNLGFGWDLCHTTHPGVALVRDDPAASAGSSYLTFDSDLGCVFPCGTEGDDAQFGFWLDAPVPAEPAHLYFDALSLDDETPSGIVQIDTLGPPSGCASDEPLATVDLAALAVANEWQTRCVTLTPREPFEVFGLYVSGERFHLAMDAFRFGPPCHAE
ncbi:MAG TPA: hypothetical protein VFZ53_13020 [Polyangiaceae bacterium]